MASAEKGLAQVAIFKDGRTVAPEGEDYAGDDVAVLAFGGLEERVAVAVVALFDAECQEFP